MHESVCLDACVNSLVTNVSGTYIDATFGRGGHATAILEKLDARGMLIAFDRDPEAALTAANIKDNRLKFFLNSFSNIPLELEKERIMGQVDGILLDLGVSSPQLDTPDRGFSFRLPGPLDMRMDPSHGRPASDWLACASEQEIMTVIKTLGEEKYFRRITKAIVNARELKPIQTTIELAELVSSAVPYYEIGKHPATRTFQAIRMHVNNEIEQLEAVLAATIDILKIRGRIVVLSYHSLEHKLIKQLYKKYGPGNQDPKNLMASGQKKVSLTRVIKAQRPSAVEVAQNRRARSAYLRVFEKIA